MSKDRRQVAAANIISIQDYMETLIELKTTLSSMSDLLDKLSLSEERQTEEMNRIATEIKRVQDKIANIELKLLLTNAKELRRNGNGNDNGNGNGNGKKVKNELSVANKAIVYQLLGIFIAKNWRFFVIVIVIVTLLLVGYNIDFTSLLSP